MNIRNIWKDINSKLPNADRQLEVCFTWNLDSKTLQPITYNFTIAFITTYDYMRLLDKQQLDHLLIQRSFALRNDDMHAVMKQLRTKKWKYVTDGNDFAAICSPKFETRTQLKKYVQQFIDIYAARVEDRQLDFITD